MTSSRKNSLSFCLLALAGAFALASCSGTSSSDDGGDAATPADSNTNDGPTLYGLSVGDSCFDIVSAAAGSNDGCDLGVADTVANMGAVGSTKLVHYDMATATLTVGTAGSLGDGVVTNNMGTLLREGDTSDSQMTTCTWHQKDTSVVTLTATNQFDISVTEVESNFAAACTAPPTGGMCTSTWTWTMKKNPNKSPTSNPPCSQ
ncbi:MAG TPA: hypothetical protein VHJ20_16500 [Polyangia bacterium]|nr:hypothetical protein [Polyangia bacterium]